LGGSLGTEWAIMYGNAEGTFRMESNETVMKRGPERLRWESGSLLWICLLIYTPFWSAQLRFHYVEARLNSSMEDKQWQLMRDVAATV